MPREGLSWGGEPRSPEKGLHWTKGSKTPEEGLHVGLGVGGEPRELSEKGRVTLEPEPGRGIMGIWGCHGFSCGHGPVTNHNLNSMFYSQSYHKIHLTP